MANLETVETYLRRSEVLHEQIDEMTWVIQLDNRQRHRIALRVDDPIVLFTTPILDLSDQTPDREKLFMTLLQLNNELMHSAYAIQGDRIVLSGALPIENLDLNEFQSVLNDITMGLDHHSETLQPWGASGSDTTDSDSSASAGSSES